MPIIRQTSDLAPLADPFCSGTAFAALASIKPALRDWLASETNGSAEKFESIAEKPHAPDALTCRNRKEQHMRGHHEELSTALPALAFLIPLVGALWARVKSGQK